MNIKVTKSNQCGSIFPVKVAVDSKTITLYKSHIFSVEPQTNPIKINFNLFSLNKEKTFKTDTTKNIELQCYFNLALNDSIILTGGFFVAIAILISLPFGNSAFNLISRLMLLIVIIQKLDHSLAIRKRKKTNERTSKRSTQS